MWIKDKAAFWKGPVGYLALIAVVAAAAAGLTALLMNIFERKAESRSPFVRLVEVGENDTNPAKWGKNWPVQYDSYKRTALTTRTRFGGHQGSESLPAEKIDRDPWLKRMFAGYAFSIDYRDRRGHAYMLHDQEQTQRLTKPQSGSCLHCHASIMPLYRQLGRGDAMRGFEQSFSLSYKEVNQKLHETGHAHPVSCVDCHDPTSMSLRVTRPGFIRGIQALAESEAPLPALPSVMQWREGSRKEPYEPNRDATRNEMRSFVCGQCHVEYYCGTKMPLTFPWGKGLTADNVEAFWDETKFPNGERFVDYNHAETQAPVLKAQHPEFELWTQGIHARSGVSCADCHMPYMREGASKVSDHWVRSPLLNVNRACQTCHRASEEEMKARVDSIQQRTYDLMQRGGAAIVDLIAAIVEAQKNGTAPELLDGARQLQRRAQWRLDFIAAENSMGFHAPQEAARVLGEAIDYARQGQVVLLGGAVSLPHSSVTSDSSAAPASKAAAGGSATPNVAVPASSASAPAGRAASPASSSR